MKTYCYSLMLMAFCLMPLSETSATQIHLIYETAFYTEFSSGQWTSANATSVKTTIASRVLADYATYGVSVSESSGDIAVHIGASTNDDAYGKAITGVGSYYYDDTPYAEIYTAKFASEPAWQGANATSGRIAEALSGTVCHEVGHIFNLYHAFMYDAYNPYYGEAKNSIEFPADPYLEMDSTLRDYFVARSDSVHTRIMVTYPFISTDQRATENRIFSDYSAKTLAFATNGGGTISGTVGNQSDPFNLIWGLRNLIDERKPYTVTTNISVASANKLYLPKYTTLKMNPNIGIDVYGRMDINRDVTLGRNGASGLWNYLDIKSTGTLYMQTTGTIEYGNGILLDGTINCGNNSNNIVTFSNCQGGLWVFSGSPTLRNMRIMNCSNSSALCSTGSSTAVTLDHVRLDTTPVYGLYLVDGGDAVMTNSAITGTSSDCIKIVSSTSGLNLNSGFNDFYPGANKAIGNISGVAINAQYNYWGASNPVGSSLFAYPNDVTWTNWSASPYNNAPSASKRAVFSEKDPFIDAYEIGKAGDWRGALERYYSIIDVSDDAAPKKTAMKNIIQINRDNALNHDRIQRVIEDEAKKADGWYKANLDFLLAMIDVYDKKYDSALKKLDAVAVNYRGSSYEVEALSRSAIIYGDCLLDKQTAALFAGKAAAINPGQPLLLKAFRSADKAYSPWEYTNTFANDGGAIPIDSNQKNNDVAPAMSPTVAVTPNPANPATTISFALPAAGNVKLDVYAITGQKVATLVDDYLSAGNHAAVFDGANLASGMYFYRLETAGFAKTGKMMLVK